MSPTIAHIQVAVPRRDELGHNLAFLMSPSSLSWQVPTTIPPLQAKHVQVWRVPVDVPEPHYDRLRHLLTPDELARADRYAFMEDCRRSVVSRGVLRMLLACHLNHSAESIRFNHSKYGKPELAREFSELNVQFNVSHSGKEVLIAIADQRRVGADVEHIRPSVDDEEIRERFFTPGEAAALRSLPCSMRGQEFFAYWTCKEALIKARGEGLSLPLDAFEVRLIPGEMDVPVQIFKSTEQEFWLIRRLPAISGYAAAVAAEGNDWVLACWQWDTALSSG